MGKKKKEDAAFQRAIPAYFSKDNNLISSKSKMTLLGRKLFDAAIMNVELGTSKSGIPVIKSEVNGQEIREFLDADYGSLYDTIKELVSPKPTKGDKALAPSLLDWRIIIMDDEQKKIVARNVITDAEFENGKLTIVFNNELKNNLIGYKSNFTLLNKQIISKFSSTYSYQLYQIFKQTIDRQASITGEKGPFELKMDLVDLKVQLGLVEANENEILYKAVTDESVTTYDAVGEIKDEKYVKKLREYGNFRIYAIERAKADINELSDISMEYEPIKRGRGGRKVGFRFIIKYKEKNNIEVIDKKNEEVDIFDFIDDMRVFMDASFSSKDLKSIAEASKYDMNKVKKAYEILENMGNDVLNPTGFMIKAIKDDYPKPKKTKFNNFKQNEYDFDELEKALLDN